MDRRKFLAVTGAAVTSSLMGPSLGTSLALGRSLVTRALSSKIKAVVFDAFPIFNPSPVFALAEQLFPCKGTALSDEWRVRQFEYAWLRVAAHHYADFWQITQDALVFSANKLKLELTGDKRNALMNAYLNLTVWPDVPPALSQLKTLGLRLAFLSNLTPNMLAANIKKAGIENLFEQALSTDRVNTYKPDPGAYQLAIDVLGLKREEILFAAFAGWDAAGAKLFGYPTFWVNRLHLPVEELGAVPDASGDSLSDLVQFLGQTQIRASTGRLL